MFTVLTEFYAITRKPSRKNVKESQNNVNVPPKNVKVSQNNRNVS